MISAKDEPEAPLSPAMDGLLRVHKQITESSDGDSGQPQRGAANIGPTRLLVPASQAGSLIGKQGATIKSIQDSSKCVVRIVGKIFAFSFPSHVLNFVIFSYLILHELKSFNCMLCLALLLDVSTEAHTLMRFRQF